MKLGKWLGKLAQHAAEIGHESLRRVFIYPGVAMATDGYNIFWGQGKEAERFHMPVDMGRDAMLRQSGREIISGERCVAPLAGIIVPLNVLRAALDGMAESEDGAGRVSIEVWRYQSTVADEDWALFIHNDGTRGALLTHDRGPGLSAPPMWSPGPVGDPEAFIRESIAQAFGALLALGNEWSLFAKKEALLEAWERIAQEEQEEADGRDDLE